MRFIVNLLVVLGARLARPPDAVAARSRPSHRASCVPLAFFPALGRASADGAAVGVDGPDPDRHLHRAAHRRDARVAASRCSRSGPSRSSGSAASCSRARRSSRRAGRLTVRPRDGFAHVAPARRRAHPRSAAVPRVVRAEHDRRRSCSPFIDFVVVLVLFSHFPRDGGLDACRRSRCSTASAASASRSPTCSSATSTMIHLDIRSGQFDVVLLRPVGTLLQVIVVRPRVAPPRARRAGDRRARLRARRRRHHVERAAACCCCRSAIVVRAS